MNADGAHFLLITLHFVYTLANQKCATLATQPFVNTYLSFLTILSCCYTLSTNIAPHLLHSVYTLSTLLCYTFLLHFVYAFLLHFVYTSLLHFFVTLCLRFFATLCLHSLLHFVYTSLLHFFVTLCLRFFCYTLSTLFATLCLHFFVTLFCHTLSTLYTLCYTLSTLFCYTLSTLLLIKNAPHLNQKATTAPRIPMWSPTMVLTRRHFA
jgi:hypothetical protein